MKAYNFLVIHSYTLLMQMTIPFFLKSTTELIKMFDKFSLFSGLKTNNARCEVAGIGVRKGVKMHSTEWNVSI